MSVSTPDAFFSVLEKSGLLSDEQLAEAKAAAGDESDPKAVARQLVKQGQLSKWQAGVLLTGRHQLKIGKYQLLERISAGGLGDVYLAQHDQLGRRVAIKTLSRTYTKNEEAVKGFLDDARKIATLDHRNVIHVYDIDTAGGRHYLVMEHAEGQDLQALFDEEGRLSSEAAADYVRQAADGLAHAHEKGILHRRLTPSNLLVDEQGTVKILNLGTAQLAPASDAQDDAPQHDEFQAPELADAGEATEQADVYSLGEIGLMLLTGKLPSQKAKPTKSALENLFRKMAASDPAKRVKSAAEVVSTLDKWLAENRTAAVSEEAATNGAEAKPAPPKRKLAKAVELSESTPVIEIETDPLGDLLAIAPDKTTPVSETDIVIVTPSPKKKDAAASEEKSSGGFAIEVAPKTRNASAKAPASTPAPKVTPAAKASARGDEPTPAGKKKLPLALIIGVVGGSVALLVLIAVGSLVAFFFLRSSGGADVAQNDSTTPETVAEKPADKPFDPEAEFDPEGPVSTSKPVVADAPPPVNATPTANTLAANNVVGKVENVPPVVPATSPPESIPPVEAAPNPEGPEKPAEPPQPEPEKVTPPPMPKPEPPKAAPPKPQNPFVNLAKVIDLPPLGTSREPVENDTNPVELGPIQLTDADLFLIDLAGGEHAYKGKTTFALRGAKKGVAERSWEIVVGDTPESQLLVAKLWVENSKLMFQWTKQAEDEFAANYLRNCMLSMRTGVAAHTLALRKPVEVEPIVLDLTKGGSQFDAKFEAIPDRDSIVIEVTKLDGNIPENKYDPSPQFKAGEATKLIFGKEGEQVLYFQFSSSVSVAGIKVAISPNLAIGNRPVIFNPKKFGVFLTQQDQAVKYAELRAAQPPPPNLPKDRQDQMKTLATNEAELAKKQLELLKVVEGQATSLTGARIEMRVFYNAGEHQVDLARTPGAAK